MNTQTTNWKVLLLDKNAPYKAQDLSVTARLLMQAMLNGEEINLKGLENVSGMHLATILRATYSRKEQIPGWDEALVVARNQLTSSNLNASEALIGLE